jgi:hypothetical protein
MNKLCDDWKKLDDGEEKEILLGIITEDVINQHDELERGVNLCDKLQDLEERSRILRKLDIKPNGTPGAIGVTSKNYKKYREANMKLNKVILSINERLNDLNRLHEITGGNSMKRKSMKRKRKSMKRKCKSMKRKSMKRKHKSMKRKSMKRKRKSMKRKYSKRN